MASPRPTVDSGGANGRKAGESIASLACDLLNAIVAGRPIDEAYLLGFAQAVYHLPIRDLARQVLGVGMTDHGLTLGVRLAEAVLALTRPLVPAAVVRSSKSRRGGRE